ncbi:MAG TPA: Crp/Fnr family transcriptional regulator [Gemmatimonadales bacterium]|jgi:CRP/FNR family transcriptional regulator
MAKATELLRNVPLFRGVGDVILNRLAARCASRTVADGHIIFRAGDPCSGMYIVVEGRVRIYRAAPDGRDQTIAVEGPGHSVAELPLVDGGPYPASAVATVRSQLLFLPRADFEHAFRTEPEVAAAVVRTLGARLRHLVQLVETLAFRDVAARLAMFLADLAERNGRPAGDAVAVKLDRTQGELAVSIGTARESVSRAIKQLEGRGLIVERTGRQLVVAPPARLRAWARGVE